MGTTHALQAAPHGHPSIHPHEGSNPYISMKPDLKLVKAEGDKINPESVFPYQSMVGGLFYLSLTARPDVALSVSVLSRFLSCPGTEHCEAAEHIV